MQTDSPIRIQLAVRTSNVHWSAVDLEVSKTGVKMLQIDAAADPSATVGLFLFDELKDKFNDMLDVASEKLTAVKDMATKIAINGKAKVEEFKVS